MGFSARLYKINNPIAEWHEWRQADTASVARSFYKYGWNPILPIYDDMSDVSGDGLNLKRLRFVEFPIYNSIVYLGYLINGGVNEAIARAVSIIFSLGSIVFLYLITKKHFDQLTALLASLVFALLPYSVFYSRTILPEPLLVFLSLGMFYFAERWIREDTRALFSLSIIFSAAAFLTKPVAIFYLLPLVYSAFLKDGPLFFIKKRYTFFLILSLLPFGLWRIWISFYPMGIPASGWLLNGNHIRFKPAFWRWIIGDRFGREILSPTGTFLFFLGLLIKPLGKESKLLHLFGLSLLTYLIVIATGNVQHDYYQYFIVPALSIFVARGLALMLKGSASLLPKIISAPVGILFFALMFILTLAEIKGLYQINNPSILMGGARADQILPKDAVVIAPYQGDTAFLYAINRPGFPVIPTSVDELVSLGATHYVSINYDADTNFVMKNYKIIEKTPEYLIADIREKISTDTGKLNK